MGLHTETVVAKENRILAPTPHRYDLIATDYILVNVCYLLSFLVIYGADFSKLLTAEKISFFLSINAGWSLLAIRYELYNWYERIRVEQQLVKIFKALFFLMAGVIVLHYSLFSTGLNSRFLFTFFALSGFLLPAGRVVSRIGDKRRHKPFNYIVIGGCTENLNELYKAMDYSYRGNATAVGRFGSKRLNDIPHLGGYNDIKAYLLTSPAISKVIYFYSNLTVRQEREIMSLCMSQYIDVEVAPRVTTIFPRSHMEHRLGDLTMMTIKEEPLCRLKNKILKRGFDLAFSSVVLLLIFPVLLPIVALAIYLEDPGPIFFRQERSGYRNKPFMMWKFRSMRVNKDADKVQATKNDDRITKVGAFLRKTSLDEFPQFINVFLGDMSVVGPRPHMLKHTSQYAAIIAPYMIRQKVRPGVTGLAQIKGYRGPTAEVELMEKRVMYDVWYLENWSLLMDFRCIIMTIVNAARGEENAF